MTAVEYLVEQFKIYLPSIHQKGLQDTFEQSLEMEKQQIIDAATWGALQETGEKYYLETYKKDNK